MTNYPMDPRNKRYLRLADKGAEAEVIKWCRIRGLRAFPLGSAASAWEGVTTPVLRGSQQVLQISDHLEKEYSHFQSQNKKLAFRNTKQQ